MPSSELCIFGIIGCLNSPWYSDSGCGRWESKDAYLACSCPCVYAIMRVVWYLVHDFSLHFQIAKSWTSRGVKTFEKLASKRMLKVAVVSYDHFTMSYRVALYHGCVPLGLWKSSAVLILLTADRAMGMLLQLGHTTSLSTSLHHHQHHHETDYLNFHLEDEHTGTVPDFLYFLKCITVCST